MWLIVGSNYTKESLSSAYCSARPRKNMGLESKPCEVHFANGIEVAYAIKWQQYHHY